MGALKNAIIDRGNVAIPYPVNLFDPPVEAAPDYGDEDAPAREAMSFLEYMAHVAQTFRQTGILADRYFADLIAARVQVCQEHGIDNPLGLYLHDAAEAQRIAEDYARLLGRAERAEAELARRNP